MVGSELVPTGVKAQREPAYKQLVCNSAVGVPIPMMAILNYSSIVKIYLPGILSHPGTFVRRRVYVSYLTILLLRICNSRCI